LRRKLECKTKNKLGERGEICLHVKRISTSYTSAASVEDREPAELQAT
jgi:hypothetical protein